MSVGANVCPARMRGWRVLVKLCVHQNPHLFYLQAVCDSRAKTVNKCLPPGGKRQKVGGNHPYGKAIPREPRSVKKQFATG